MQGNFSRGGGSRGNWRGRGQWRGRGRGRGGANGVTLTTEDGDSRQSILDAEVLSNQIDEQLGFARLSEGTVSCVLSHPTLTPGQGQQRLAGWSTCMRFVTSRHEAHQRSDGRLQTILRDDAHPEGRAAVDFYFIEEDGNLFKSTILQEPYFFLACRKGSESQVEEWLMKKFEGVLLRIERKRKEDLKMVRQRAGPACTECVAQPNHLLGYRRTCIQLFFANMNDFFAVRREVVPIVEKNKASMDAVDAYAEVVGDGFDATGMDVDFGDEESTAFVPQAARMGGKSQLASDFLIDIREYDVNYCLRVAIDKGDVDVDARSRQLTLCTDIRAGLWYTVSFQNGETHMDCITARVERNDPVVLAFDIEVTKAPLKFPDSAHDQIMMISYMIDGQGYLITNREIVSEDIEDFEYTPKPEYEGPFTIFNEESEAALLKRFFEHWREVRPTVVATYNGDGFDFPYVDARAKIHALDMKQEIGFFKNNEGDYESRQCAHMDCFK
jgi:DNA polymerase epsilon subunit 1